MRKIIIKLQNEILYLRDKLGIQGPALNYEQQMEEGPCADSEQTTYLHQSTNPSSIPSSIPIFSDTIEPENNQSEINAAHQTIRIEQNDLKELLDEK